MLPRSNVPSPTTGVSLSTAGLSSPPRRPLPSNTRERESSNFQAPQESDSDSEPLLTAAIVPRKIFIGAPVTASPFGRLYGSQSIPQPDFRMQLPQLLTFSAQWRLMDPPQQLSYTTSSATSGPREWVSGKPPSVIQFTLPGSPEGSGLRMTSRYVPQDRIPPTCDFVNSGLDKIVVYFYVRIHFRVFFRSADSRVH